MEEAETQQRVEGPFIFPYNKRPGRIAMKKKKEKKEKKTKRDREKKKKEGEKRRQFAKFVLPRIGDDDLRFRLKEGDIPTRRNRKRIR